MADHPTADILLAFADGDRLGTDFSTVAEHVAACDECREVVDELRQVGAAVQAAHLERKPDESKQRWPALAARIEAHRSRRSSTIVWGASLVAAGLLILLVSSVQRNRAPLRVATDSVSPPTALVPAPSPDEAAAAHLERALHDSRARLSPTELRAIDGVVGGVELAIRQTRAELVKDPENVFLLDHLAQLQRQRISALETFVDLARDRA